MKTIYESAAETAKKVRTALKQTFPGIKFSVTSSTYSMGCSVSVHWTDGPMSKQVDSVLNRFKSSSFDGMQDMKVTTGYMFEGQHYNGADYVSGSRTLTPEYRKQIEDKAVEMFADYDSSAWGSHRQFNEAEADLIGLVEEVVEPAVIAEPLKIEKPSNVVDFTAKRVQKWEDSLTPEQRLKMFTLKQFFNKEQTDEMISTGKSIDEIFAIVANEVYNCN